MQRSKALSCLTEEVSDWMGLVVMVHADGEWVESDLLWRDRVGGMVGKGAVSESTVV